MINGKPTGKPEVNAGKPTGSSEGRVNGKPPLRGLPLPLPSLGRFTFTGTEYRFLGWVIGTHVVLCNVLIFCAGILGVFGGWYGGCRLIGDLDKFK